MAKLGRPGMPDERRRELWDRWARGESISDISRAVGRPPGSIFTILRLHGGYVPPVCTRRPEFLSLSEREEISRGLAAGESMRSIARRLGRAPSTVSREIRRNKGRKKYRAVDADDRAWRRARRPKPCLLARRPVLAQFVADKLAEDWSPEQISGHLAVVFGHDPGMQVSHETIYETLFIQSRGVRAKDLQAHLRTRRPIRRSVHNKTKGLQRSVIKDLVSISERPPEVEDRAVPGHWEGDLLLGRGVSQIATVVERSTRFTVLVQLDGRDMNTVAEKLSKKMNELPLDLRRSLTWDRGMELARHADVTAWTGLQVYFADPRSPWQRGTNENTNGGLNRPSQHLDCEGGSDDERQREVQLYRGQIPSPGRPTIAWREDRVRFWTAIASGMPTEDAAVVAGVSFPVAFRWFRHAGGVNPCLPPMVSGRYLSFSEREDIAIFRAQGQGVREIARRLGRNPSTISRELRRNASTRTFRLEYKASLAQWHAERRARRPRVAKLVANDQLRQYVQDRLSGAVRTADGRVVGPPGPEWKGRNKPHRGDRRWVAGWSPEQISKRLRVDFPHDEFMRISHEAIYQALYVQSRGALKRELVVCLRTGRALRVPRARSRQKAWAHVTPEVMISERPAEVGDRAVPGHWEGDLLIGLQRSAIGTLVERTTRFTMLIHLPREEGFGVIPRTKNGPPLAGTAPSR